jgi:hypothetical protein
VANTPYKVTELAKEYIAASSLAASYPSPLRREPFAAAMRSQDSVLAGRRLLVSQHTGGCNEWLVDSVATGGFGQSKPLATVWRVVARARTELMAGAVLVARVIAVPSGATEYFGAGSRYLFDGASGAVRFVIDYINTSVQTASETVIMPLASSDQADGVEDDSTAGRAWQQLQHRAVLNVRPADVAEDQAEAAKWSEWPTVTMSVEHRGGARVVHASLAEEVYTHTVADIVDAATTCNGIKKEQTLVSVYPVEDEADGATYEEYRHGVHRLLNVAARQTARVGPRICHWTAYSEELSEVADTEADAIAITSATAVRVSWQHANANTTWLADAPGWDIPQTRRLPEHLSSRLSGAAVSPVRLRVYARFSAVGGDTGYLRVQSTARSWVTVAIDQATIGTTWTWVTITGFLEANTAGDDAYAIVQDFAWTTGGTLELRAWDLSYGDYEVGT